MELILITKEELKALIISAVREAISVPVQAAQQKYLTPVQLAELIGWKLSTVYQNHSHRLIPGAKKIGSRLLFDFEEVTAWITENSIQTKAEKITAFKRRAK